MSSQLIFGKPVVETMISDLAQQTIDVRLSVIQVGNAPESESYIKQLRTTAAKLTRLCIDTHQLRESTTLEELFGLMTMLNLDRSLSGYMLHLPLPPELQANLDRIRSWINAEQDIDMLGYTQRGKFFSEKRKGQILPPTPYAVMKMLKMYLPHRDDGKEPTYGKRVAIVGDGQIGSMLKHMLRNDCATQLVINDASHEPEELCRMADIIVGAAGVPDLITKDWIKEGAVVINVGMKFMNGKMHGDIDVESVREKAAMVTPVLGGTGPVTVAALIQNAYRAELSGWAQEA
jgi:methylenetetrahydrofolate dehydrogenase (NADP+)/methenyltetrahydrofolate cyclohydrolase